MVPISRSFSPACAGRHQLRVRQWHRHMNVHLLNRAEVPHMHCEVMSDACKCVMYVENETWYSVNTDISTFEAIS